MKTTFPRLAFWLLCATVPLPGQAATEGSAALRAMFQNPPREFSTGPLWNWNDLLTEEQVVTTLRDLAAQQVRQVWVHPQPGLMTPYLSADWFRLWKAALREAKALDLNIWIYDENSYPSGFAGGYVPEAMPESRGRGLHFREGKPAGQPGAEVLGVYRLAETGVVNVTPEARASQPLPAGKYLSAVVARATDSSWFAGHCYVDLLYPGVTEKFLEITLDKYQREVGSEFGRHIPGVFMDEPSILPAGGLPWTEDLPAVFQKRWGYALLDHLPSLAQPVGDWRRIRHNYFQVLLDLYIERWAKPYYDYCQRHGLELTGHYLEHDWPKLLTTPDFMALQAWEHRPGIDILMNQYQENPQAQFGNVRIVKEIGSVANQLGRRRTLSETYAGSGWEIRFEEMKRQGDWQYALGLNTLNECLSHITIRGVRKGNWPRSLSYHNPWWESYHMLAGYFTRLSAALAHGQQINPVLVLEPTTAAWMYQNDPHVDQIGNQFQALLLNLERAQVEYDLGSEDILARHGSVNGQGLVVGQRQYPVIVLPPLTENLNTRTLELLESCLHAGATVLCCGPAPSRIDGLESPRGPTAAKRPGWRQLEAAALPAELRQRASDGFLIHRETADRGLLFHHRRQFADGQLLFLVNTSLDSPSRGSVQSSGHGVELWSLENGRTGSYPFATNAHGLETRFDLPPCGSLLLFLANQPAAKSASNGDALRANPSNSATSSQAQRIPAVSGPSLRRLEDNVLVLNYLDLAARGLTLQSAHCREATSRLFKQNGLAGNPWFESVQFADEHIRRQFPPESAFEATYRFTISGPIPDRLQLVLERPDLYRSITCNGVAVSPIPNAWWLDHAFGRLDIRAAARAGENQITIQAGAFTVFHELEPAYILGNFRLRPAGKGFEIVPDSPLQLAASASTHTTSADRNMWLSGGIGFRPDLPPARKDDCSPWLIFDLGQAAEVKAIRIWNYNEPNWSKLGVKQLTVAAGSDASAESLPLSLGTFELSPAPAADSTPPPPGAAFPQTLPVQAPAIRWIRFDIRSNHNGVSYPTTDPSHYFALVGLSEVQFLGADGKPVGGVKIHQVSGELDIPGLCQRRAADLVNGSGLLPGGWNVQGHPFYSGGVAYAEEFDLPQPAGRYWVELPAWLGSVAKVSVNGQPAGCIGWQPWECEVSEWLQPGRNRIEVTVLGTLRNALGPHHAGPPGGIVSPGMFNQAPPQGPPPGAQYQTIGYGLFAPFVMKQRPQ